MKENIYSNIECFQVTIQVKVEYKFLMTCTNKIRALSNRF